MFATTPAIRILVIFLSYPCADSEDDRIVRTADVTRTQASSVEWTADQYPTDDWSVQLVKDNIFALGATKVFLDLSADDVAYLYNNNKENNGEFNFTLPRKRRDKRSSSSFTTLEQLGQATFGTLKTAILHVVIEFIHFRQHKPRCYEKVGCFHHNETMALRIGPPAGPEDVNARITFFSRDLTYSIVVDHENWMLKYVVNSGINLNKTVAAIIHGFAFDVSMTWMDEMKDALLKTSDCNVLTVNWVQGAKFPNYGAAAANTPMPGTLLSLLLQAMVKSSGGKLNADKIHIIGFSLGAHAAGFCGRHFYKSTNTKLGRITGLDPAGPLFDDDTVALSPDDAQFVDAIHTDSGTLYDIRFGIRKSVGHVDFFPNGGNNQPQCDGLANVGCSHMRARELFQESITSTTCSFTSYPCGSNWPLIAGRWEPTQWMKDCRGEMGYRSTAGNKRGNLFLRTARSSPYCVATAPRNW